MGLIDEVRDHDEKLLNEVVLPLLNVSRRMPNGEVNPQEINQQQLYMTSAGVKTSFAYQKLIDIFITSIIAPDTTFCFGCDYRIPLLHGLIDKAFVMNQKASASYSDEAFAREYLSSWTGSDDESWFNYERLLRYRKLKNPEKHYINRAGVKQFYLLSVDVGRFHDQTVAMIFRVTQKAEKYYSALVNIKVLGLTAERKRMQQQAIDVKKLIFDYSPREVVIDTNGVGAGLADEMIVSQIEDGVTYPAYGFFNDENYKKIQPKDAPQILFSMKANATLKPQLHSNVFNRINSGRVRFLIKEQEAKSLLLETKVGRRMDPVQRAQRLMPHELTTKLFEEMLNLRLKRTGTSLDINLEQINTRYPDDKYMAFAYGLWRIKELEETEIKKQKRRNAINISELVFYTGR